MAIEQKLSNMKMKIIKSKCDVDLAEKESLMAQVKVANNDTTKKELIEENIAINRKVRDAFGNRYPEDENIYQRYTSIKEHIKRLELDLNSA